jgi:hypothetical protein
MDRGAPQALQTEGVETQARKEVVMYRKLLLPLFLAVVALAVAATGAPAAENATEPREGRAAEKAEPAAQQAQTPSLNIEEMVFCEDVQNREPVGASSRFPGDVEQVYCYTRVTGAHMDTSISHIWYHDGKRMAEVELKVGSPNWRTWSYKSILGQDGTWRVEVVNAAGEFLTGATFTVGGAR